MFPRTPLPQIAVAAAAVVVLAGCSSTEGGAESAGGVSLIKSGKLTNCTGLPYKPFEFKKGKEIIGFDIELMDLVAKDLGVEQEVVDTPFEGIESGEVFNSKQCDLAAAGMTITPEREKKFLFSDPYFDATQALLVKKGSGYKEITDFKGKKFGVQQRTTGEEYAKENAKGAELVQYEDLGLLLTAVQTGQVEGGINDNGVLYDYVKDNPEYEVTKEFDTGEQYGIGMETGNKELKKAVDKALKTAKEDGTYDKIYEKWFGTAPQ